MLCQFYRGTQQASGDPIPPNPVQAQRLQRYITGFTKYGLPVIGYEDADGEDKFWPTWRERRLVMTFGSASLDQKVPDNAYGMAADTTRGEACEFWRQAPYYNVTKQRQTKLVKQSAAEWAHGGL